VHNAVPAVVPRQRIERLEKEEMDERAPRRYFIKSVTSAHRPSPLSLSLSLSQTVLFLTITAIMSWKRIPEHVLRLSRREIRSRRRSGVIEPDHKSRDNLESASSARPAGRPIISEKIRPSSIVRLRSRFFVTRAFEELIKTSALGNLRAPNAGESRG